MPPKKKKSKKKKDKGSYIGAALIPPTIFTAVPRVPPIPRHAPELSPGLSTALLSTGLLTQLIGTPTPTSGVRRRISDTDTSLPDFDESVDPGYSSVEYHRPAYPGVSGQNRRNYTDRDRAQTPTDDEDSLEEDDYEDDDPTYAQVRKPKVKKCKIEDHLRTNIQNNEDALVGDPVPEEEMKTQFVDLLSPHEVVSAHLEDSALQLQGQCSRSLHQYVQTPMYVKTPHQDMSTGRVEEGPHANSPKNSFLDEIVMGDRQDEERKSTHLYYPSFTKLMYQRYINALNHSNSDSKNCDPELVHSTDLHLGAEGSMDINSLSKDTEKIKEECLEDYCKLVQNVESYIQESQSEEKMCMDPQKKRSLEHYKSQASQKESVESNDESYYRIALRNILKSLVRLHDERYCATQETASEIPKSQDLCESDEDSLVGNIPSDTSQSVPGDDSDLTRVSDVGDEVDHGVSPPHQMPSGSMRRYDEEDLQALRRSTSPGVPRPGSSSSMRRSMSPSAKKRSQSPSARSSLKETVESVVSERMSLVRSSSPRSPRGVQSDSWSSDEASTITEPTLFREQAPLAHSTFTFPAEDEVIVAELKSSMESQIPIKNQRPVQKRRPPIEPRMASKQGSPKIQEKPVEMRNNRASKKSTRKEIENERYRQVKKRRGAQEKKVLQPHPPPVNQQEAVTAPQKAKAALLHTQSPKLAALEQKNEDLLRQQQDLQAQLEEQKLQQEEIMAKLAAKGLLASQNLEETTKEEMGSLLHETQSVTEGTLQQQNDLIMSMENRGRVLEQEKRELRELNEQLQAEINSLRRMASIKDNDEAGGTQIMVLKKQLQDFKEERETLKSAVQRLTSELSRYQSRFRPPSDTDLGFPMKGPVPSWLINTKYLAPLFLEYDDRLREKENSIRHYESELEGFGDRIEEILKENQRLHLRLEQTDISGPVGMTEWRQLQEQCRLVLEENQLLMEQLELQQNKARDMHRIHVQEVTKLSKKLVQLEAERSEAQSEAEEVRHKLSEMKRKHEAIMIENTTKVALEEHVTSVSELKRGREEEKIKMTEELANFKSKIQIVQTEKKGMALHIEDLKSEIKQMEAELRAVQKSHRKSQQKVGLLRRALEETEQNQKSANNYLTNVVRVAEKMANERNSFAQVAHDTERQKQKAMNKAAEGNMTVNKLEEKLRVARLKASEKVQKAIDRLKQQDEDFNVLREEYEREIKHLRLLLREREDELNMFAGEKKQVEDDLETMWQTVTADNRRMRETMRKSVAKLKEHTALNAIISEDEEDNKQFTT